MSRERLSMRNIREVLRLRSYGLSQRQIAASCHISSGAVCEYLRRAEAAGIGWPLPEGLSEAELESRLFPPPPAPTAVLRPVPDWADVERELKRKGVTRYLLWEEYRATHADGYGYSRFCQLHHAWRGVSDPRMHQVHKAGEKLFVDYAGHTMPVVDRKTGAVRDAQIFVAALGASSYTYVEATWSQSLSDWITSHVRAFAFFQGVPEIVVPDNLRSGVRSPCYYEPDLNPTYQELAQHYGLAVLPARVRKPRDKAKVENAVQQTERRVLAPLRDRTFFSLEALNEALGEGVDALNNRAAPGLPATRSELFATLDQPALRPLPAVPYQFAYWLKARVQLNYHVQVDEHWYSVPYTYLKQQVEVRLTAATMEVFRQSERIASHRRSYQKHGYTTVPEHMPPAHRAREEWTAERLIAWASKSGPATAAAIEQLLTAREHPQQAFKACLGVLRLGQEHGGQRLEAACRHALTTQTVSYRRLKGLLSRPLEQLTLPEPEPPTPPLQHPNVRGARYYDPTER